MAKKYFAFLRSKFSAGEKIFAIFFILVIQFYIPELTGSPGPSHTGIRYNLQYSLNVL